jgi:hypothetical protein
MYPFLSVKQIEKNLPEMERLGVSKVARSKGQFLEQYRKYGANLPLPWISKRENFIKRHLAQYVKNPTVRRKLALIAWAFLP